MVAGTQALLELVRWDGLPQQDLSLDMSNLPGLPHDRMRVSTLKQTSGQSVRAQPFRPV